MLNIRLGNVGAFGYRHKPGVGKARQDFVNSQKKDGGVNKPVTRQIGNKKWSHNDFTKVDRALLPKDGNVIGESVLLPDSWQ
mgnify:CR=1 FL=1